MTTMDAITLLRSDHKTVEQHFKRFEKAGERAYVEKREIVDKIIEELSVHAAIEEQVFYPVARGTVPATEDIVLESLEEHHIVKWVLSELEGMDPQHERFDAKVTVLMENVRHHVKEEETEFFPRVRDRMSRKELSELGDALETAKKSAPTSPHPRSPDSGPAAAVVGTIAGVVDRVADNISGAAQGGVNAAQDLIARMSGSDRPKVSPTGSTTARKRADSVRKGANTAAKTLEDTAQRASKAATKTAKSASSGAKATTTSAKRAVTTTANAAASGAKATKTTAKRAATTTARTAKKEVTKTVVTAKRGTAKSPSGKSGK